MNKWFRVFQIVSFCLLFSAHIFLFFRLHLGEYFAGRVPLQDFDIYIQTSRELIHRELFQNPHPYQNAMLHTAGAPLMFAPFLPLSPFSIEAARSIFAILSVLSVGASTWIWSGLFVKNRRSRVLLALTLNAIVWLTFPARFAFQMGQPTLIMMFLITVLLMRRPRYAFLYVALLTILKSHFLLMGILFLHSWKKMVLFVTALLLTVAVLSPVIKLQYYVDYVRFEFAQHFAVRPSIPTDMYNQSLKATTERLHLPMLYPYLQVILSGFLLISFLRTRDPIFALFLALFSAPILWQHYIPMLYPVYIAQFSEKPTRKVLVLLILSIIFVINNTIVIVPFVGLFLMICSVSLRTYFSGRYPDFNINELT